jgi:hypothetical protein
MARRQITDEHRVRFRWGRVDLRLAAVGYETRMMCPGAGPHVTSELDVRATEDVDSLVTP